MARVGAGAGTGQRTGRDAVSDCRRVRDRVRHRIPLGRVHLDVGSAVYHLDFGDYRQAIDLLTQALAIDRDTGHRYGKSCVLNSLGRGWLASGDPRRAAALLGQAVSIADATGDVEPSVDARSWLAQVQLQLSDPAAALAVATARRELRYSAGEPTMRLLEGLASLELHRVDEAVRALSGALTAADAPLALADRNVVALQAQALALSGLAAATGDPGRARETAKALTRLRTTTSAAGVAADTSRLLDVIASHDRTGILAEARADGEW